MHLTLAPHAAVNSPFTVISHIVAGFAAWSSVMILDDIVDRHRGPVLRLVTASLAIGVIAGTAFLGLHGSASKPPSIAGPLPTSVDPIQTGSIPGRDAPSAAPAQTGPIAAGDVIGDMIEKLDSRATPQHR